MIKITINVPDFAADTQPFSDLVAPYLQSLGYSGIFAKMLKDYAMDKVVYNLQEKAREFQHDSNQ